jgi:hypothetical protein
MSLFRNICMERVKALTAVGRCSPRVGRGDVEVVDDGVGDVLEGGAGHGDSDELLVGVGVVRAVVLQAVIVPGLQVGLGRLAIDQENYLFNLFSKQHGPFEVKLVYNAMESFQQKVPPISFGAFEDIFDRKEEESTRPLSIFYS